MENIVEVFLVRHGESEANYTNTLISFTGDPGLTEHGRAQAREAARQWNMRPKGAIYASGLRRAQETARAFVQNPQDSVQTDDRLHEIRLGIFDGRRIKDIQATDQEMYLRWKMDPELPPPGGERLSEVAARVRGFLEDMAAQHSGIVVAISHADCLKAITLSVLEAPWQSARYVHFENLAGVYLKVKNDGQVQMLGMPVVPPWPQMRRVAR